MRTSTLRGGVMSEPDMESVTEHVTETITSAPKGSFILTLIDKIRGREDDKIEEDID